MAKNRNLACIDVGTTKACAIMAEVGDNGRIHIIGVGMAPSVGLHKGLVVNTDEAKQSIRESVRKVEEVAGYKLKSAYIGVTGRHISLVNNRGAIAIMRDDCVVRPEDLRRVLEVASNIKVPRDRELLHVIPRAYAVDNQEGIKNPVGMHGFRLDVEANIVTAAVSSVQNLTKCIRSIGIDIDDLVLEPMACAEAVLTEEEKQDGVLLADIGGGTTDIAVFKDSTIYHTSVLPIAGYAVTRDISIGLGLPFDLAEQMKKKYGDVTPDEEDRGDADRTVAVDEHTVSYRDLSRIMLFRVEELLRLILLELPRTDYANFVPAGLVLTGGGANLRGIAEFAHEITHLPVRIGTPVNLYGLSGILCDPAYATSIGLLLWGSKYIVKDSGRLHMRQLFKRLTKSEKAPRKERPEQQLDKDIQDFEKAKDFFESNKLEFLSKYQNKYVAIRENEIVDSDEDFSRLAGRVYSKLGYRPIYMPKVTGESTIVRLPSPRIRSANK